MITCSMPECQTPAGCLCARAGAIGGYPPYSDLLWRFLNDKARSLTVDNATLRKELAEARAENERLRRLATDRSYMLEAYRNMLGEKGLEVAKAWDEKGMVRCHFDWGQDGLKLTGEQRAEFILGIANMPHSEEETFAPPTRPAKHVSEHLRSAATDGETK